MLDLVHLLVPDMLRVHANLETELPQASVLADLLARASQQTGFADDESAAVYTLLTGRSTADSDPPVAAAMFWNYFHQPPGAYCLLLQAVYLEVGRSGLVLSAADGFGLTEDHSRDLLAGLAGVLQHLGEVRQLEPGLWILLADSPQALHTTAPARLQGQRIDDFLPAGADARAWHQLMNEIQMVFHHLKLNGERLQQGQLPISGIWPWGGGRAEEYDPGAWRVVFSDDPYALGMAGLGGIPTRPLPAAGADLWQAPEAASAQGRLLVQHTGFRQLGRRLPGEWLRQLSQFEQTWLVPLFNAVKTRKVNALVLDFTDGRRWILNRSGARSWWRRRRPLRDFLEFD